MYTYIPRVGLIYVATLTSSWVQVLTEAQCKNVRGVKFKARVGPGDFGPKLFDVALSNSPDETGAVTDGSGYLSYTGSGYGDLVAYSNGIWARTRGTATVILEMVTYN